MDHNSRTATEKLLASLESILPENVEILVDEDGVSVSCNGKWLGTNQRTFLPGAVHPEDLESVLGDVQDHIIHCLWGYWPVVSGSMGVFRVKKVVNTYTIHLEFKDADDIVLASFDL